MSGRAKGYIRESTLFGEYYGRSPHVVRLPIPEILCTVPPRRLYREPPRAVPEHLVGDGTLVRCACGRGCVCVCVCVSKRDLEEKRGVAEKGSR